MRNSTTTIRERNRIVATVISALSERGVEELRDSELLKVLAAFPEFEEQFPGVDFDGSDGLSLSDFSYVCKTISIWYKLYEAPDWVGKRVDHYLGERWDTGDGGERANGLGWVHYSKLPRRWPGVIYSNPKAVEHLPLSSRAQRRKRTKKKQQAIAATASVPTRKEIRMADQSEWVLSGMRAVQWSRTIGELRTMVALQGASIPPRDVGDKKPAKWEILQEHVDAFIALVEERGLQE